MARWILSRRRLMEHALLLSPALLLMGGASRVHSAGTEPDLASRKLPSDAQLRGTVSGHVVFRSVSPDGIKHGLMPEVHEAFTALAGDARKSGIGLHIASAFRNYRRQKAIWNAKANGERVIYDEHEKPLSVEKLNSRQLVFAILHWSALPGLSRHHWGTDLDVYDAAALPRTASVTLSVSEARTTFARLHRWLDERIASGQAHGFYRPYDGRGLLAREPWHLSYAPTALPIARYLDRARARAFIADIDIALRDEVLEHFDEIYDGYIGPYVEPPASTAAADGRNK